jgi:hypothetical protein
MCSDAIAAPNKDKHCNLFSYLQSSNGSKHQKVNAVWRNE